MFNNAQPGLCAGGNAGVKTWPLFSRSTCMSDSKTILLVEDDAITAMSEQMELEKYGYTVITAVSGEEAIEIFRNNNNIDLILMDIDLGKGINGPETAGIMLQDNAVPVVFLSSHTEKEIVRKTEQITSYGYVVKNTGITVLDASIKMAFKLFDAYNKLGVELNERKRAEMALQESEIFLKETQKIAHLGGWKANPQTDYLEWTDGVYDIIEAPRGYKPGLTEGMKYYPPEHVPFIKSKVVGCLETGEPFSVEVEIITETGKHLWTEVRGIAPVVDGRRSYVIGTFQDITDRKQAESKIQKSE
jgi:CheY-like chemotaxis protein